MKTSTAARALATPEENRKRGAAWLACILTRAQREALTNAAVWGYFDVEEIGVRAGSRSLEYRVARWLQSTGLILLGERLELMKDGLPTGRLGLIPGAITGFGAEVAKVLQGSAGA